VEKMVMNDRQITIREDADEVGISIGSYHNIFSNVLGKTSVSKTAEFRRCLFVIFWPKTTP
jgi:hypothetical protein